MTWVGHYAVLAALLLLAPPATLVAQHSADSGTIVLLVRDSVSPVADALVRSDMTSTMTDLGGRAHLRLGSGDHRITVAKIGYRPDTVLVVVIADSQTTVGVLMSSVPVQLASVTIVSTRAEQSQEETPIRVEVVTQEEMGEKSQVAPGTIANLLDQIPGVRVQATSAFGGATVRIQGLRGRYTQVLSDGLPLYGGQTGSVGILQIPPLDLDRVEVIRGVASALYGAQALGGVINLLSRPPVRSHDILLNQTSRDGNDVVGWSAGPVRGPWSYSLIASGHRQDREDLNEDGWADIAGFRRLVVRPRMWWSDSAGSSFMITAGATIENRESGTLRGARAPDGSPFPEALDTRRFDLGVIGRVIVGQWAALSVRLSGMQQRQSHTFGSLLEHSRYRTGFAEIAYSASPGDRSRWVIGGAFQAEGYHPTELPGFSYTYSIPGIFGQFDRSLTEWLRASASARIDFHNSAGTWLSPRFSLLFHRSGAPWAAHLSTGTGFSAPTPLIEETEEIGLSRLLPLRNLSVERARALSGDVSGSWGYFHLNASIFGTEVNQVLQARPAPSNPSEVQIINAAGPSRSYGGDLLLHWEKEPLALTVFYGYLHATENDPETGQRREVPLNPRHRFGADVVLGDEEARVGVEATYTGRQTIDEDGSLRRSRPYAEVGILAQKEIDRTQVFLNVENIFDVRLSRYTNPIRSTPGLGGRWTIDPWVPMEGRVINAGLRLRL